jgi:DNA-directed RNA polymerase specialized sigma24 family protein
MNPPQHDDRDAFPKTSWSLIGRASASSDPAEARAALSELVRRYLPALRFYLTSNRRLTPEAADDLLQEFLASKVLEQGWVGRADADRGKFRTFLLTALRNFLFDHVRAGKARKRSADGAFDEAWAREIVRQATTMLRQQCEADQRPELWAVFEARLLKPAEDGSAPMDYEEISRQLGSVSAEQLPNLLVTAKRIFTRKVREAIAEYCGEDQVDQEIFDLREALSRATPR